MSVAMHRQYLIMLCLIVLVFLSSCVFNTSVPVGSSQSSVEILAEDTPANGSHPEEMHLTLTSGLRIDEYALQEAPQTEPLTFVPFTGSQEDILNKHALQRSHAYQTKSSFINGHYSMSVEFGDQELLAREVIAEVEELPADIRIEVMLNDKVIYSMPAGEVSPLNALQGLWFYDGHWVVEVARVSYSYDEQHKENVWHSLGQILRDGQDLNQSYDYQESFGFQLLNEKPFYFFSRDGEIGFSYDDEETNLGKGSIYHYGCCSAAELNPKPAKDMVSFFTQKEGYWYYVEIGIFE